uniref:MSP domain-containing protein n=1 Tax=Caenorhabditis tropicalis TaxID=1561998 RepID=A0A1I7T361_9PELO
MAAPNNTANDIITNVIPHLRHSCEYNCVIKYTMRRGEVVNVPIMAVKYMPIGTELTLPFRNDFMESVEVL